MWFSPSWCTDVPFRHKKEKHLPALHDCGMYCRVHELLSVRDWGMLCRLPEGGTIRITSCCRSLQVSSGTHYSGAQMLQGSHDVFPETYPKQCIQKQRKLIAALMMPNGAELIRNVPWLMIYISRIN